MDLLLKLKLFLLLHMCHAIVPTSSKLGFVSTSKSLCHQSHTSTNSYCHLWRGLKSSPHTLDVSGKFRRTCIWVSSIFLQIGQSPLSVILRFANLDLFGSNSLLARQRNILIELGTMSFQSYFHLFPLGTLLEGSPSHCCFLFISRG